MRRGFTLFELLVSLVVAGILTAMAVPAFDQLVNATRASATINDMARAVAISRSAALTHQQQVRLCPGTGNMCGARNQWRDGLLVFIDQDADREIDLDETVITRLPGWQHGRLSWRAFRNRPDLVFTAHGLTDWLNGSFLYCPDNNDPRHARMLILNVAGRARHAPDRNGDGIREDASGRPLNCTGS